MLTQNKVKDLFEYKDGKLFRRKRALSGAEPRLGRV